MKSVPAAIAVALLGTLGACAPAAKKGAHYLSIRNDARQDVYVTYGDGVQGVSATIAPNSRVIMRGAPFRAKVHAAEGPGGYHKTDYVHLGSGLLGTFDSLDARLLPSGDQVRVYEDDGALRAAQIGFGNTQEVAK